MKIFEITKRPDRQLFTGSHDSNDFRVASCVRREPDGYANARIVLLGCPQDEGVRRNRGRPGAGRGPEEVRRAFYKLAANEAIRTSNIFDLGDIVLGNTLEETHAGLRQTVRRILEDGKLAIVLGGGNDISYPDCAALADVKRNILVFNIDKHFDVRDLQPGNSGTPYRQLLEEGLIDPGKFYEMGSEEFANSPVYRDYLVDKGAHIHTLVELRSQGIGAVFRKAVNETEHEAVFWGFDMDAVRAADAPGVSASYPTGLTADEIITLAGIAGKDTVSGILEFTEVNPEVDIDNRTSKLTALLIHTFLSSRKDG